MDITRKYPEWQTVNFPPKILSSRMETNVENRYAKTLIITRMQNDRRVAAELTFSVAIPEEAFISSFSLEVDGKKFDATVKEKEKAAEIYRAEVIEDRMGGQIVAAREANVFEVSVNIEPQSIVTYELKYEELLRRKYGKYELKLNMNPGGFVEDFKVVVNIREPLTITSVEVLNLRSGATELENDYRLTPEADVEMISETRARVTFAPSLEKQLEVSNQIHSFIDLAGIIGQLVIQYDVDRDPCGGEVLIDENGYFIHFFAPELPPLKKQVIFILDSSGSMTNSKMGQLIDAMNKILSDLKPEDSFSIIQFNSKISVWDIASSTVTFHRSDKNYFPSSSGYVLVPPDRQLAEEVPENRPPPSVPATPEMIENAKAMIKNIKGSGNTDIHGAIMMGLKIINQTESTDEMQPIIIFLTDGEPTIGITNSEEIVLQTLKANTSKVPIYTLSFGNSADREFLQLLSLHNQAFTRHIYEACDAAIQLSDFYKEISSPLLENVKFIYADSVDNVTKTNFRLMFDGSELSVSGRSHCNFDAPHVVGRGRSGELTLETNTIKVSNSLERIWAYLTIKNLIEEYILFGEEDDRRRALELSIKYSFVTDLTSMVVVKPKDTRAVNLLDYSKSLPTHNLYPNNEQPQSVQADSTPKDNFLGPSTDLPGQPSSDKFYFGVPPRVMMGNSLPEGTLFGGPELQCRMTSNSQATSRNSSPGGMLFGTQPQYKMASINETVSRNSSPRGMLFKKQPQYRMTSRNKTMSRNSSPRGMFFNAQPQYKMASSNETMSRHAPQIKTFAPVNLTVDLSNSLNAMNLSKPTAASKDLQTTDSWVRPPTESKDLGTIENLAGPSTTFKVDLGTIENLAGPSTTFKGNASPQGMLDGSSKQAMSISDEPLDLTKKASIPLKVMEVDFTVTLVNLYEITTVKFFAQNVDNEALFSVYPLEVPDNAFVSAMYLEYNNETYQAEIADHSFIGYNSLGCLGPDIAYATLVLYDTNKYRICFQLPESAKGTLYVVYERLLTSSDSIFQTEFIMPSPLFCDKNIARINFDKIRCVDTITSIDEEDHLIKENKEYIFPHDTLWSKRKETTWKGFCHFGLTFDLEYDPYTGKVSIDDGYFAFPMDPDIIPEPVTKLVFFIIDPSTKSKENVYKYFKSFIKHLKPNDAFVLIHLAQNITIWDVENGTFENICFHDVRKSEKFSGTINHATRENIKKVQNLIDNISDPDGPQSLVQVMEMVLKILKGIPKKHEYRPVIVLIKAVDDTQSLLTERELETIQYTNENKVPFYAIIDAEFLDSFAYQKLCITNKGFAKRIYHILDIDEQITEFHKNLMIGLGLNLRYRNDTQIFERYSKRPSRRPNTLYKRSRREMHVAFQVLQKELENVIITNETVISDVKGLELAKKYGIGSLITTLVAYNR